MRIGIFVSIANSISFPIDQPLASRDYASSIGQLTRLPYRFVRSDFRLRHGRVESVSEISRGPNTRPEPSPGRRRRKVTRLATNQGESTRMSISQRKGNTRHETQQGKEKGKRKRKRKRAASDRKGRTRCRALCIFIHDVSSRGRVVF